MFPENLSQMKLGNEQSDLLHIFASVLAPRQGLGNKLKINSNWILSSDVNQLEV